MIIDPVVTIVFFEFAAVVFVGGQEIEPGLVVEIPVFFATVAEEDWQVQYAPHGIDEKTFFPIANNLEFEAFKKEFYEGKEYDFVVFWNSRKMVSN